MLEERGIVVAVEDDAIWVETQRKSACGHCEQSSGCGTGVLSTLFRVGVTRFRVAPPAEPLNVGDAILIGLEEQALLRGSLMLYLLPLLALFLVAAGYDSLAGGGALPVGEGYNALAGLAGLILGFVAVRWLAANPRRQHRYQPIFLRKAAGITGNDCVSRH